MLFVTKYSASGCNYRPIKFLVMSGQKFNDFIDYALTVIKDSPDAPEFLKNMLPLPNVKEMITRGSPHMIIAYGTTDPVLSQYAFDDATIQLAHFELIAVQRGYGTLWSAFMRSIVNVPGLIEYLGLAGNKCYGCLNLGIPRVKYHYVAPRDEPDVMFM